jgi:hypothetical protein
MATRKTKRSIQTADARKPAPHDTVSMVSEGIDLLRDAAILPHETGVPNLRPAEGPAPRAPTRDRRRTTSGHPPVEEERCWATHSRVGASAARRWSHAIDPPPGT